MGRSSTANRHRMWCKDCNALRMRLRYAGDLDASRSINPRYTLKRAPWLYVQESRTKCKHCGSLNVRSDEAARRRELAKQERCYCLPFPHNKGRIAGCEHWEGEVNEHDFEAMINTPRGTR